MQFSSAKASVSNDMGRSIVLVEAGDLHDCDLPVGDVFDLEELVGVVNGDELLLLVLFIKENEYRNALQLLLGHQPIQALLGLRKPFLISAIHHVYDPMTVQVVFPPD